MARFRYKAVAPTGTVVEGELEAIGRTAAIERLRELKHLPVRVDELPPLPIEAMRHGHDTAARPGADAVGRIEPVLEPERLPPDRTASERPIALGSWNDNAALDDGRREPPVIERMSLDETRVDGRMEPSFGVEAEPPEPEPPAAPAADPVAADAPSPETIEAYVRSALARLAPDRPPLPPAEEPPLDEPPPAPPAPPASQEPRPLRWDIGTDAPAGEAEPPAAAAPEPEPAPAGWSGWQADLAAPAAEPAPAQQAAVDEPLVLDTPLVEKSHAAKPFEAMDWGASGTPIAEPAGFAADERGRAEPQLDGPPLDQPEAAEVDAPPAAAPEPPRKKKKRGKEALPARLVPVFTRELQVLLSAGLPVDRALRIIVESTADDRVAAAADALFARVRNGALLSEAMDAMPDRFDEFLRTAVRAGEAGGALPEVLDQVASYQERGQRLLRSVKTALVYPTVLAFAAAFSVILLLTIVVPQFEVLFRQSGQRPPLPTQIVIDASIFLRSYGWIVPAACLFLWIALRWRFADARRAVFLHRRALRLPVIGPVVGGVAVERFARALGTLLGNGVTLPEALALVANTVPNRAIGNLAAGAVDRVKQGERLGDALEEGGVMPLLAVQLVRVGEESGKLVDMLARLAEIYAQEVDTAVRRLTALIEPVLILVIGSVVGGIVLSLLAAIAGLNALAL